MELIKQKQILMIDGKGKNKKEAYSEALGKIQQTLLKQSTDVFLRIEPLSVEIVRAVEIKKIERFLFLFFSREVKTYSIKLNVAIEVTKIPVDEIEFISEDKTHLGWIEKLLKRFGMTRKRRM